MYPFMQESKKINTQLPEINQNNKHYLNTILNKSDNYLKEVFSNKEYKYFLKKIEFIYKINNVNDIVKIFSTTYFNYIKELYQKEYKINNPSVDNFINKKGSIKLIWGDCHDVLKNMKSETIDLMVTSPPYYNARKYSQWKNINEYMQDMEKILIECYRVLDNHRVFVFNVGDIFDNDNLYTKSTWGKRRLPLGAYFINLFEKVGFTFVDDIIWDKGEVQSERNKNGDNPYPMYQYPINCYEHILIFHKHRLDMHRYPCPICGTLNVNGNSYTEKGLKSWECKNKDCFVRSKSNRGKRFSAKTYITQSHKNKDISVIDKDFLYSWRRDIKKINPVIKINSKGENILGHTAPFPKDIPEFAIKMFSYVGDKVLDPFSGIGTSIKSAHELNRIGIGIEKDLSIKPYVINFLNNKLSELEL